MKVKINFENFVYIILFILSFIGIVNYSLISYANNNVVMYLKLIGIFFRVLLIVISIIFFYKTQIYSKEKLCMCVCLILVMALMLYKSQTYNFFDLFYIAIICANRLSYKKVTNVFFYSILFGIAFVFFLNFLNYFPALYMYREQTRRYNFGFSHPNILGRVIMLVTMLWFIKRDDELNFTDILIGASIVAWIYFYPNSVSSSVSLLLIIAVLLVLLLWKKFFNKDFMLFRYTRYWMILLILAGIGVIYYFVLYKNSDLFLGDFSETFYTRFTYAYLAIKKYGWTLFGNPNVEIVSSTELYFKRNIGTYFPMDLFYVYLPIVYGVIPALFFTYMYIKALLSTVKLKKNVLLVVVIVMLVYSLMESAINTFCFSFIFILPFCNTHEKMGSSYKQ